LILLLKIFASVVKCFLVISSIFYFDAVEKLRDQLQCDNTKTTFVIVDLIICFVFSVWGSVAVLVTTITPSSVMKVCVDE